MKCKTKKSYWQQGIKRRDYIRAFLQGVLLISGVSYLFYGTPFCAILLSPYFIPYLKFWERQAIQKRKQEFQLQCKEAIQSMATALNVGYSVENAMRETWKDLQLLYQKDEVILQEFRHMRLRELLP